VGESLRRKETSGNRLSAESQVPWRGPKGFYSPTLVTTKGRSDVLVVKRKKVCGRLEEGEICSGEKVCRETGKPEDKRARSRGGGLDLFPIIGKKDFCKRGIGRVYIQIPPEPSKEILFS